MENPQIIIYNTDDGKTSVQLLAKDGSVIYFPFQAIMTQATRLLKCFLPKHRTNFYTPKSKRK
jgi:hypothetical protein